eukprot:jgi/Psemu1/312213/fgenesh1_kg.898_\
MPMKRITSMPETRFLVSGYPTTRKPGIGGLGPLHEHKPYGTDKLDAATRKVSDAIDNDAPNPAVDDGYGFFSMDDDIDISGDDARRERRRGSESSLDGGSSSSNSENSSDLLGSSHGSTSSRQRSSRRKSALRKGSKYGEDNIPLDFERKEFSRVLPKPDLSQRASMPVGKSPRFIRSGSRGMFRVSSEPVFVRPVYLDEGDGDQDLRSNNDIDQSEHSESSFVEGAMKKRISFGTIQIREHTLTIGDNPSCSYGAPIQLDWNHQDMQELKFEDYEAYRPEPRTKDKLHLNSFKRTTLLKDFGHSTNEINESKKRVSKARNQREWTKFVATNYPNLSKVEDAIESSIRKVKRSISKTKLAGLEDSKTEAKGSKDDLNVSTSSKTALLEIMNNDESNVSAPW